ncbi:MAG: phosphotransferase, partial [Clostridia bacterium]
KIDQKLQLYADCALQYENGQAFLAYISANRHLLQNRPQVFQHGDYHIGNMMIDTDGTLQIIDFDRCDFGDPWEEFNRIVWYAQSSAPFASGMVNGYFDGDVPMKFWRLLALYIALHTLSALPGAIPFGQGEIDTMRCQAREVLSWYNDMQNPVPTWYLSDYHVAFRDGLPFKRKAPFAFDFLAKYGRVFQVFDDQDSGNLCFGCERDGARYFIKFAGAPTQSYQGTQEDAIARLQATFPIYRALHHPNLIEFVGAEKIGGGFAMIFAWTDGVCMGRQYPAAHQKFMQADIPTRLDVFRDILSFFAYVAIQGYVAVDFYDGSILYDFHNRKTMICDIDFFRKAPCVNDMGRMWGSSRFMSPEEFALGATLDEITNVYTLGATAFALFADCDRRRDSWTLHDKTYAVAAKAVRDSRAERQRSVRDFIGEWKTALCQ